MHHNIYPYLIYYYHKLHKFSLIGIGLLFVALILFAFQVIYLQPHLQTLKIEHANIINSVKTTQQTAVIRSPIDIFGNLDVPNKTDMSKIFEFIFHAAKQNNINIDNVDYKYSELPLIDALSYQITLPVSGRYLDITIFLDQISQKNNGIILTNIELSRENIQVNEIDGLMQFIVYMKK